MSLKEFGLLLAAILLGSGGQFLLKLGALKLGQVNASNFFNLIAGILTVPELVLGLAFYATSAILYILLLTRVDLSVAGPAVAVGYIFAVLLGYFFLQETLTLNRLLGLGLIVGGVILVISAK